MQRCCCRCDGSAAEVDQLYQWAAACVRVKSPRFEIVAVLHDQYSVLDIRWMGQISVERKSCQPQRTWRSQNTSEGGVLQSLGMFSVRRRSN